VSLLLAIALLLPSASPPPVETDFLKRGNEAYREGNYAGALALYEKAAAAGENEAIAYFNIANCHYRLEEIPPAIVCYRRVLDLAPTFLRASMNLARIYISMDELGEAKVELERALRASPDDPDVLLLLGDVAYLCGDNAEALRQYERVRTDHPDRVDPYLSMADVYAGIEDWDSAIDLLRTASDQLPEEPSLRFALGNLYYTQGDVTNAAAEFMRGLALDPDRPDVTLRLARCYQKAAQDFLALYTLEKAMDRWPDNAPIAFLAGQLSQSLGRIGKAAEYYARAARYDPALALTALVNIGHYYHNAEQYEEALKVYEQAFRIDPTDDALRSDYLELKARLQETR
jgi:tetratricopeptide (TPR) repeat protein